MSASSLPLANESKLRVVTEEFIPYQMSSNSAAPSGLSVALVNMILKEANMASDIEILPWARAYKLAQRRKNVLIFSMAKSVERLDRFVWIGPLFQLGKGTFVTLKYRKDITARNFEELKKYRVCSELNGWVYEMLVKKGFQENVNLFGLRGKTAFTRNKNWALRVNGSGVELPQPSVCDVVDVIEESGEDFDFEHLGFKKLFPLRVKAITLYAAMSLNSDDELRDALQTAYNTLQRDGLLYQSCQLGSPSKAACNVVKPN
jgi:ABC-type amino acid transport substrate-binding protein